MYIHADKRPTSDHTKRYNASESFKVVKIMLRMESEEMYLRDIVLRNKHIMNRNGYQVLGRSPIAHSPTLQLSTVLYAILPG